MKRVSEKSIRRLEKNKRKIQSFIELIDQKIEDKISSSREDDKSVVSLDDNKGDVFANSSQMKSELRKKLAKRHENERPKIFIDDQYLLTQTNGSVPPSLTVDDIQSLVVATLLPGPRLSSPPNWCKVYKPTRASKVAIFAIDYHIGDKFVSELNFKHSVQFETHEEWIDNLLTIKLSNRQVDKMHKERLANSEEPIEIPEEEKVGRTQLLLSTLMMDIERFPMVDDPDYSGFKTMKQKYIQVTDSSPMFSIDCEMCYTTAEKLEVTRISVVDEKCQLIYDTLVKPKNKIIDYLTRFSGITKKLLNPIDVTLEDVHKELDRILPEDAILCGQSLNSDLQALQLIHPYIIDTSVIYNMTGHRQTKSSLKDLSRRFLKMHIQNDDKNGHDSTEDAVAAMKLVKLKLAMGLEFGDRVLSRSLSVHWSDHTISLTSYLERHDVKLGVFYDYSDIDSVDKSLVVYRNHSHELLDAISRVLLQDKAICLVIDRSGKCLIKF